MRIQHDFEYDADWSEIAEQLNDKGKWFIQTLCDYMGDKAESEES